MSAGAGAPQAASPRVWTRLREKGQGVRVLRVRGLLPRGETRGATAGRAAAGPSPAQRGSGGILSALPAPSAGPRVISSEKSDFPNFQEAPEDFFPRQTRPLLPEEARQNPSHSA